MINLDGHVCLGVVAGAWGVQGAVRLKSFCSDPETIAGYSPLTSEDGSQYNLKIVRQLKGAFAATLTGVSDREAADALRGTKLYAARTRLPTLPDDEFYYTDLIGLAVSDTGGAMLGTVKSVMDHGAGDILEIERPSLSVLLLPFTHEAVPTVDLSGKRIVVDIPTGLEDEGDE
jgi:16S rRNA processing protein RimM